MSLPIAQPPQSEAQSLSRLLYLVEGDAPLAVELGFQLRHFGYEVRVIGSATEAAKAVEQRPPDAILVDMMLPEGELAGARVVQQLRRQRQSEFPVLFMSVRSDFAARLAAVQAGAAAYLTKPLDVDLLVELLDRFTLGRQESPYRVLLVDDDATLARHYELVLSGAGMIVRALNRPDEILDAINDLDPDVILLDLYMPRCSGLELAGVIRQCERYLGVPIVFLSTEIDRDRQLEALRMGGDEFLTKPVGNDTLFCGCSKARSGQMLDARPQD